MRIRLYSGKFGGLKGRDLKPSNIVVDGEGHALLTDFGLSKEVGVGVFSFRGFKAQRSHFAGRWRIWRRK